MPRATMTATKSKHKAVPFIQPESSEPLTQLVLQACLVAKDAAFNLRDFIENSSNMAFLAVKDCEEEITTAITEVGEAEARQLLACLKFIIDLERIGDLTWSATQRLQRLEEKLTREDAKDFIGMARALETMLTTVHDGFAHHDLAAATTVMKSDMRIDDLCRSVFHRHLSASDHRAREYSVNLLFVAQAFERAGDHAKNLGEELYHLVEGRSLRHEPKRSKTRSSE
jgi:phosphate transport system protein